MDELIPGEILEDIECLDPEDSYENENDALNFDTFGISEPWSSNENQYSNKKNSGRFNKMNMPDLNSLYLSENHSNLLNFISNIETSQDNLLNRRLDELDNDSPSQKSTPTHIKRDKYTNLNVQSVWNRNKSPNVSNVNVTKSLKNNIQLFSFEHDIKIIRNMGFFSISASKLNSEELEFKVPDQWRPPISLNVRHINSKAIRSGQDCLFMSASEFDNILRIQLTQVSKNPKLQNYSGRWNFKLMNNPEESENPPENNTESIENEDISNKIKCFGRTSVACIRHGRKLIYLKNSEKSTNEIIPPNKRAKWAIEDCYEQLYIILDLIDSIKSGVGSIEKLKAIRDQKLISLYESLTQTGIDQPESNESNSVFEEILNLNKGKKMVLRISKTFKPTLKIKLVLEILKCRTLYPLMTESEIHINESDHIIDLYKFVCASIEQITAKRISSFIDSFLILPNVHEILPKVNHEYGIQFAIIIGNKIIQGLEGGCLGESTRVFVDLISSNDGVIIQIKERIIQLIKK